MVLSGPTGTQVINDAELRALLIGVHNALIHWIFTYALTLLKMAPYLR